MSARTNSRCCLSPLVSAVDRGGENLARDSLFAECKRAVLLDGEEDRLLRTRLARRIRCRQIDSDIDRRERRGDHEDDQQHQDHVDERRNVDLRNRSKFVVAACV